MSVVYHFSVEERKPAWNLSSLKKVEVADVRTIDMAQGQKITRVVAWTFLGAEQQQEWREQRWMK